MTLAGCASSTAIPFSNAKWSWRLADVRAEEGNAKDKTVSVYGGDTYLFDKTYLGHDGTIKYMFNEEGNLASVAWTYTGNDSKEVMDIFKTIDNAETKKHGESEFSNTNDTAYGDVWYLDGYHIVITAFSYEDKTTVQYAYINEEYSAK